MALLKTDDNWSPHVLRTEYWFYRSSINQGTVSLCFQNGCSFLSLACAQRIKIVMSIPDFFTISSFFTLHFLMLDYFRCPIVLAAVVLDWAESILQFKQNPGESGGITKFLVDVAHCCRPVQFSAETLEWVLQEPDIIKMGLFCSRLCWLVKENRHGCVHLNLLSLSYQCVFGKLL